MIRNSWTIKHIHHKNLIKYSNTILPHLICLLFSCMASPEMWRAVKILHAKAVCYRQDVRGRQQGGQGQDYDWVPQRVWSWKLCNSSCLNNTLIRQIQVLVSTDCAGMGVHVPDLRLVVNIGMEEKWLFVHGFGISLLRYPEEYVETSSNIWKSWSRQVISSSCSASLLARPKRFLYLRIHNNRCLLI